MNKKSTALILLVMIVAAAGCIYAMVNGGSDSGSKQDDYKIVETLDSEMKKISKLSCVSALGDAGAWHVYELGLMNEKNDDFFNKLRNDLGDDFSCKLSNGDSLFIGILPYRNSYRIYAGSPDEAHMLYPEWNYTELKKK